MPPTLTDLESEAVTGLDAKAESALRALRASGIDDSEMGRVVVRAILDQAGGIAGPSVEARPSDGRLAVRHIDRSVHMNIAATAILGAAL